MQYKHSASNIYRRYVTVTIKLRYVTVYSYSLTALRRLWFDGRLVKRPTGDGEVAGSSLTSCAVVYGLGHTCLCHQAV